MDKPIRIMLLDDHPIVIQGIKAHLQQDSGFEVVGTYTTARELVAAINAKPKDVDVAIVDFALGPNDVDGLNLLRALTSRFPNVEVLVLSAHFNPATVSLALQAGVKGFMSKGHDSNELKAAIRSVSRGKMFIPKGMQQQLDEQSSGPPAAPGSQAPREQLTPREYEVLRCTLDGMSTSEISHKFSRAMSTISTQKKAAFQKLGIRTDAELFKLRHLFEQS